jgi:hypothetical protein
VRHTISNLQGDVLPALENQIGGKVRLTLGGVAPEDQPRPSGKVRSRGGPMPAR